MKPYHSLVNVSQASHKKTPRQIFVAYSYRLYDKRDYRRVFSAVAKEMGVDFVFADQHISSIHILQKIVNYIQESEFGLYDITGWNPNVTLELGLALGLQERVYLMLNPSETEANDAPSDLKGVDRLQYLSFSSLEDGIRELVAQHFNPQSLKSLQDRIVSHIDFARGLSLEQICQLVGVKSEMAERAITNELGRRIFVNEKSGSAKYFVITGNL